ncbi:hypothetical protein [Alicyclobacillus suci]|uniref:hypothetical protein n=1 Tax=Alicyclobacillus suci TaxID=2816080 RepID=UPI001A8E2104|nr:hypothetical protein [Alicyclobacillus suci]
MKSVNVEEQVKEQLSPFAKVKLNPGALVQSSDFQKSKLLKTIDGGHTWQAQ